MHSVSGIALVIGLLAFIVWLPSVWPRTKRIPGPRQLPIFGNLLDFDFAAPWTTFTSWKLLYGDIIGLRVLGNNILVLNDLKTINDLLDKRGATYSHRPVFTVVGELMELDKGMPLMPYGPEWRESRKLAHHALNPGAASKYHKTQEDIAALLAFDIASQQNNFFDFVRMAAERIILTLTYGLSVKSPDSEYLTHVDATMKMISESTVPGAYLCDLLPFLKYLPPWVPFQRRAARGKDMIARLVRMPFEKVKQDMASGTATPSLTQDLLSASDETLDRTHYEHLVMWTTGSMYGAGGETTYSTVLNFIMAMALYPQVQERAFDELDKVLGADQLPTMSDKHRLPYLAAVIKETMRWNPVLPFSIARRSAADDVYQGYEIAKDTIIMPNAWAIAFESNVKYPPKEFIPERFLDPLNPCTDPASWAFGFGRRICPGKYVAENSVFILIATLLYTFRITEDPAAPVTPRFASHLVRYPLPFSCLFFLRSEARMELLHRRIAHSDI